MLDALQQNAKITNARLAELAGISPASMLERVRKLERAGVIGADDHSDRDGSAS